MTPLSLSLLALAALLLACSILVWLDALRLREEAEEERRQAMEAWRAKPPVAYSRVDGRVQTLRALPGGKDGAA